MAPAASRRGIGALGFRWARLPAKVFRAEAASERKSFP